MDAAITGETEELVGVSVFDNDEKEHIFDIRKNGGEITGHQQNSYPDDPSKRTSHEDEMVAQARRYAQLHVYNETDYDTLVPHRNPDRLAAVLMTVYNMDNEAIEDQFWELYRQLRSHHDDSVLRPVQLEDDVAEGQAIYKQKLYLDADIEDVRGASDEFAEEIGVLTEEILDSMDNLLSASVETIVQTVQGESSEHDLEVPSYDIEAVSDLYYLYHRRDGPMKTVERADPLEREPDAILEIPQVTIETLDEFKSFLVRHLVCQIRDVYLGSGIEPPGPYRVIGTGLHKYTLKYKHFDMYPKYYDVEAGISGYTV